LRDDLGVTRAGNGEGMLCAAGAADSPAVKYLRSLPWRAWTAIGVAAGLAGLVFFGKAESVTTPNPSTWARMGLVACVTITLIGAVATLGTRRWLDVLAYALSISCVVGLAVLITAVPSTSRSCNNSGQPRTAGSFDCDTSFAIGAPFVLMGILMPTLVVASVGKAVATTARRIW
jgi:hypothetical protein